MLYVLWSHAWQNRSAQEVQCILDIWTSEHKKMLDTGYIITAPPQTTSFLFSKLLNYMLH